MKVPALASHKHRCGLWLLVIAVAQASLSIACGRTAVQSQTPQPTEIGTPLAVSQADPIEVYVMNADGQPQLLTTLSNVPMWAWAPDDDHVALMTDIRGYSGNKVHVMSVKAGTEIFAADITGYPASAAWSPNGEWLAWESSTQDTVAVEAMRAGGSDRRTLANSTSWAGYGAVFGWKDDHTLLATVQEEPSTVLFEFDLASGNSRQVKQPADATAAELSRDSSRVVFIVTGGFTGCAPNSYSSSLWIMDVSDGRLRQMLPDTCDLNSASWSPDGSQIAYGAGEGDAKGTYVLDVASGTSHKLSGSPTLFDHVQGWSPDGGTVIVYRSKCGEQGTCGEPLPDLVLIPVAGGSEGTISGKGDHGDYAFSLGGGGVAFVNDGLQVVQVPDGTVRQAMAANADWRFNLLGWSPNGQWFAFARSRVSTPIAPASPSP